MQCYRFTNLLSASSGILCPWIGEILSRKDVDTMEAWAIVFYTGACLSFVGGAAFLLFGSADIQEWDKCPDDLPVPSVVTELEMNDSRAQADNAQNGLDVIYL